MKTIKYTASKLLICLLTIQCRIVFAIEVIPEEIKDFQEPQTIQGESLAQIIRRLIDLPQIVSAGGTRSNLNDSSSVCLLTPVIKVKSNQMTAIAITPKPLITTSGVLNEFRIKQAKGDKKTLYKIKATSRRGIETPIKWPLEPIKKGEEYLLLFRGPTALLHQRAEVLIKGGNTQIMSKNNQTIKEIRENISRGNKVNLTQTQDNDLLIEILMDPTIRTKKEVNRLRNELIKYSCEKLD